MRMLRRASRWIRGIGGKNERSGRSMLVDALEARALLAGSPWNTLASISISDTVVREGAAGDGTMAYFTVGLSGPTTSPVSVQFATADGTAKDSTDYVGGMGSVSFAVGQTSRTIAVPIVGDDVLEGKEKFYVDLNSPIGAPIARSRGTATIVDDDQPIVKVVARDGSASEAGGDVGVFRMTRSGPTDGPLRVTFALVGTATNGIDYVRMQRAMIIPAGRSFADVTITPLADKLNEKTETVVLRLNQKSAYYIGTPREATVKLANAESKPPAAWLQQALPISEAGAADYRFTVRYSDNRALDLSSIGDGDLHVTGPNGYEQDAHLVSVNGGTSARSAIAVYSIAAPGGSWDSSDSGTYTVIVVAGQVRDKAGNALVAGGLGNFVVNIPI